MKKTLNIFLVLMMTVLALAGCVAAAESDGEFEIALSVKTVTNDVFIKSMADAVEAACKAAGYNYTLVTAGSETAASTQVMQIEDLVTKGVDALIVGTMDANAPVPALQRAKDAGIPVVLIDSGLAEGNEELYVTFIGTDNYAAAKQGALKLSEVMGGSGKAILVRGANGNMVSNARAEGYKDGLAEGGVELAGEQPGDWSNDIAKQVTENMLQANPDVTGILSCSDVMIDGILQAVEDSGMSDKVKIMSFDGNSKELIKEGLVMGSMAQFPNVMATKAVEILDQILKNNADPNSFEKFIDSGTECITIESLQ